VAHDIANVVTFASAHQLPYGAAHRGADYWTHPVPLPYSNDAPHLCPDNWAHPFPIPAANRRPVDDPNLVANFGAVLLPYQDPELGTFAFPNSHAYAGPHPFPHLGTDTSGVLGHLLSDAGEYFV
jgi:hypothetical protein